MKLKMIDTILLLLFFFGCRMEEQNPEIIKIPFTERNFNMGIIPIPLNWSEDEINDAYNLSAQSSETVSLTQKVGWTSSNDIRLYQNDVDLAANYGLEIMLSVDVLTDDRNNIGNLPAELSGKDFSDNYLRQLYKNEVVQIVNKYHPKYLNLAVEINAYYLSHPGDFFNFVSLYKETYDTLKAIEPTLIIGVSFQYETLKGNVQWDLLSAFDNKLDAIYLTTYPDLFYPEYNELPSDYYLELENIKSAPIIFSEIGWQGNSNKADEKLQAKFIIDFVEHTKRINVELIVWTLLHDWQGGGEFETMGLIDLSGRKKEIWYMWVEMFNL